MRLCAVGGSKRWRPRSKGHHRAPSGGPGEARQRLAIARTRRRDASCGEAASARLDASSINNGSEGNQL